ncbi:MAG: HAD family hydrolase [Bacteroidales bacterium]|nr:HAD family hydrolase [Bacteroidales bacterium]
MAIKSISDFYNFSLFIFDLDNTIYKEEDYLFQAYEAIAEKFAGILPSCSKKALYATLKDLYLQQGRDKLFDKFLNAICLDKSYLPDCLKILRSFKPGKPLKIDKKVKKILNSLKNQGKSIFILTNGNVDQQKNKIKHINWDGLDKKIGFVFANEIEPKPSPAGVLHILKITGIERNRTIFIGDSEADKKCAQNSGISYLDISLLSELSS